MNKAEEEAIRVLEAVGHLEQAEELKEQLSLKDIDKSLINTSKSVLIYILAKTLEDKCCTKAYFPCHSCVFTAKSLLDTVIALMEKMSIYTFIDLAKETDIRKAVLMAFHYAIKSTKKKVMNKEPLGTTWQLPVKTTPKEIIIEESLKIVKISEKTDGE